MRIFIYFEESAIVNHYMELVHLYTDAVWEAIKLQHPIVCGTVNTYCHLGDGYLCKFVVLRSEIICFALL